MAMSMVKRLLPSSSFKCRTAISGTRDDDERSLEVVTPPPIDCQENTALLRKSVRMRPVPVPCGGDNLLQFRIARPPAEFLHRLRGRCHKLGRIARPSRAFLDRHR